MLIPKFMPGDLAFFKPGTLIENVADTSVQWAPSFKNAIVIYVDESRLIESRDKICMQVFVFSDSSVYKCIDEGLFTMDECSFYLKSLAKVK